MTETAATFATDKKLQDALRKPFDPEQIGKLPKPKTKDAQKGKCQECGGWHGLPAIHLDYVGHAAVTDRLNKVAPDWTYRIDRWVEVETEGTVHLFAIHGTMTIGGKSLPEVGDAEPTTGSRYADEAKKAISDFIRRAAMRFGVAIDLWHKGDLGYTEDSPAPEPAEGTKAGEQAQGPSPAAGDPPPIRQPEAESGPKATKAQVTKLQTLASKLGWGDEERHELAGVPSFNDLTKTGASKLIEDWQQQLSRREGASKGEKKGTARTGQSKTPEPAAPSGQDGEPDVAESSVSGPGHSLPEPERPAPSDSRHAPATADEKNDLLETFRTFRAITEAYGNRYGEKWPGWGAVTSQQVNDLILEKGELES